MNQNGGRCARRSRCEFAELTQFSHILTPAHLVGSTDDLPRELASLLSLEASMSVGRLKTAFYQIGFAPYKVVEDDVRHRAPLTKLLYQDFDSGGDVKPVRAWTAQYHSECCVNRVIESEI